MGTFWVVQHALCCFSLPQEWPSICQCIMVIDMFLLQLILSIPSPSLFFQLFEYFFSPTCNNLPQNLRPRSNKELRKCYSWASSISRENCLHIYGWLHWVLLSLSSILCLAARYIAGLFGKCWLCSRSSKQFCLTRFSIRRHK